MGCAQSTGYSFKSKERRKAFLTKFKQFETTVRDEIEKYNSDQNTSPSEAACFNENDNVPIGNEGKAIKHAVVRSSTQSHDLVNNREQASCHSDRETRLWHSEQTTGAQVRNCGQSQSSTPSSKKCHTRSFHPDVTSRLGCKNLEPAPDNETCQHDSHADQGIVKIGDFVTQNHLVRILGNEKDQTENLDISCIILKESLEPVHGLQAITILPNNKEHSTSPGFSDGVSSQPLICNTDALSLGRETDQFTENQLQLSNQTKPDSCQSLLNTRVFTEYNNTEPVDSRRLETDICNYQKETNVTDGNGPHCVIDIQTNDSERINDLTCALDNDRNGSQEDSCTETTTQADNAIEDNEGNEDNSFYRSGYYRGWEEGYTHGYQLAWRQGYEQGYYQGWSEGYPYGWSVAQQHRNPESVSHESGDGHPG